MSMNSQAHRGVSAGPLRAEPAAASSPTCPRRSASCSWRSGVLGLILPGPIGTPALIAGGVVLWPGTFGRISRWMERRYPRFTRAGNRQILRFISDLERRYPSVPK